MKKLKIDLQVVEKSLKQLAQKMELMTKKVAKLEKANDAKKPKARAGAAKRPRARAGAVRKVATKKPARVSSTDTVLTIINKSRQGLNTAGLKLKTGLKDKSIRAILSKLKKQGKIKSKLKGVYAKA